MDSDFTVGAIVVALIVFLMVMGALVGRFSIGNRIANDCEHFGAFIALDGTKYECSPVPNHDTTAPSIGTGET